jgi:hypothetical protein
MNKEFKELLGELKKMGLPDGQYAIFGSGPMAVRGIKPTDDLDVAVLDHLYQELRKDHQEKEKQGYKKAFHCLEPKQGIEIISANESLFAKPEEVIARAELIDGLRFVILSDLIAWKKAVARPKDFEHIKMIKDYLNKEI